MICLEPRQPGGPGAGRERTFLPRRHVSRLRGGSKQVQCLGMMNFPGLASLPSDRPATFTDQRAAGGGFLRGPFKGSSREHTASGLRCYLAWCAQRGLDPLAARRPRLELYIR